MIKSSQLDQKVLKVTTKEKLRSLSYHTGVFSDKFYLEDLKEEFYYDSTDTTSVDNGVDIFVNIATGRRYKLWKSPTTTSEIDNISNVEIPVAVSDRLPYKTLSQVRSSATIAYTDIRITDQYKEGVFRYDSTDTTSTDDGALVIVNTATGRRYKRVDFDAVDVRWFGAIADDTTDLRTQLQAAFNNTICKKFLIPYTGKSYRISNSVQIPSYSKIEIEPGVDIFGMGTNTNHTFRMDNAYDIEINAYGATLRDVYESYPDTSEFYGAIAIRSCERVSIKGLKIKDTGGDGIYVGTARGTACEDITIELCDISRVSRNGISLVNSHRITVNNCYIHDLNRMAPKAGIDIEPDHAGYKASEITINNLRTERCGAAGISVSMTAPGLEGTEDVSININNHIDDNSRYALYNSGTQLDIKGYININNPIWRNNISCAYLNTGTNPNGVQTYIYNPVVENPHVTNISPEWGMWSAFLFYRQSGTTTLTSLGGVHIYRPTIIDNVVPDGGLPRVALNGFLFRDHQSLPWTNVTIDSPKQIKVNNDKIKIYHGDEGIKVIDTFNQLTKSFTSSAEHFVITNLQTGGSNHYVKKITNRFATGDNTVEFSQLNPDLYEFEISVDSANKITLIFPATHTCNELQQGASTGFYSNAVGSRLKLLYHKTEKRFEVLDIQGKWFARNNDNLALDNGSLFIDSNTTLPKGINYRDRNGVVIIKSVPNAVSDVNIPPQSATKNQYIFIKRDADTNGNVVRIYVNDASGGVIGSINGAGRTLTCLPSKGDCILLWSDGLDYKIVNYFRNRVTDVTNVATTPTRTDLNTSYGYEREGFALYNTNTKTTYTKLSSANNSPWISADWVTGVITQMS